MDSLFDLSALLQSSPKELYALPFFYRFSLWLFCVDTMTSMAHLYGSFDVLDLAVCLLKTFGLSLPKKTLWSSNSSIYRLNSFSRSTSSSMQNLWFANSTIKTPRPTVLFLEALGPFSRLWRNSLTYQYVVRTL